MAEIHPTSSRLTPNEGDSCLTSSELAKHVTSPSALETVAWDRILTDGSLTTSLKGILHGNLFVTFCNTKVQSFSIEGDRRAQFVPYHFHPHAQLYDRATIDRHVEDALQRRDELPYGNDEDFVELMCVNPMSDGATIVVDVPHQLKRYGVVVKDADRSFHVIYRRRVPLVGPVKLPYSDFIRNARKVKLWRPPDAEFEKSNSGYEIFPPSEVSPRARLALASKISTFSDRAFGDLEWLCPPERFLFQLSVFKHLKDLDLSDTTNVDDVRLVKVYSPAKELKPADALYVMGNGHYHAGIVYSVSEDGEILVGHFRRAHKGKLIETEDPAWKGARQGNPLLTTFKKFQLTSSCVYIVLIETVWEREKTLERIKLSVEGKLLPAEVPSSVVPLSHDCPMLDIAPGTDRLTPYFHVPKWTCGEWVNWIVRGKDAVPPSSSAESVSPESKI